VPKFGKELKCAAVVEESGRIESLGFVTKKYKSDIQADTAN